MNIKFGRDGKEIGEYPEEAVPALLQSKVLLSSDLFWHDGMDQWSTVGSRWPASPPPLLPERRNAGLQPRCQQCGSSMEKTKKVEKSLGLQVVGVLVFLLGIGMLFIFPIGTVAGIILMIVAARLGYKQVKVWKCGGCGYFFERAD